MLPLAGLSNHKGTIIDGGGEEIIISGKVTVLPMAKYLKAGEDYTVWHPLAEDITMDISLVLQTYLNYAIVTANWVTATVVSSCVLNAINIVDDADDKGIVTYGKLPELSKVDVATITRVIAKALEDDKLVSITVASGKTKYASVTIPILADHKRITKNNEPLILYGVKHTKKAWAALAKVLEAICIPQVVEATACKCAPLSFSLL